MTPNIRLALEQLNYQQHNDIYKIAFEWCEKYGLDEPDRSREKSRFLDGVKLGSYLAIKQQNNAEKQQNNAE